MESNTGTPQISLVKNDAEANVEINDADDFDELEIPKIGDIRSRWSYVILFKVAEQMKNDREESPENEHEEIEMKEDSHAERTRRAERNDLEYRLKQPELGLRIAKAFTKDKKKEFLLIEGEPQRLEKEAEKVEFSMRLKEEYGGWYTDYKQKNKHMFVCCGEHGELFSSAQRIKLLKSILESSTKEGGAGLNIPNYLKMGVISKFYPLHDLEVKERLLHSWANPKKIFSYQPIEEIRTYFGEEVGLYFAWLGFYTQWLWYASIFGVVTFSLWVWALIVANNAHISTVSIDYENSTYTAYSNFTYITNYNNGTVIVESAFDDRGDNLRGPGIWAISIHSIFLAFWATLFLEFWKRYNNILAFDWGVTEYEEKEKSLLDYRGDKTKGVFHLGTWLSWESDLLPTIRKMKGHEDIENFEGAVLEAEDITYSPSYQRKIKMGLATPFIVVMLCAVVITNFCVLSLRLYIQKLHGDQDDPKRTTYSILGSVVGGVLNAITIMILSKIWRVGALYLTKWENHRTLTDYTDHLTFKTFLFDFVNSYSTLYYIAFFKNGTAIFGSSRLVDTCGDTILTPISRGCPDQLTIQLVSLLMTNIVVGQVKEVLIPYIKSKVDFILKQKAEGNIKKVSASQIKDLYSELPQHEVEASFGDHEGTFEEYEEMVIQFGYITLFAAVFPIAPLLAVFNNMIEIRTDGFKMLTATNRPHCRGAEDIGIWYFVLTFMGVVAVVTNCALIGLSYDSLFNTAKVQLDEINSNKPVDTGLSRFTVICTIVVLEHVIFLVKYLVSVAIPDVPGEVRKKQAAHQFLKNEIKRLKKEERKKKDTIRGDTLRGADINVDINVT